MTATTPSIERVAVLGAGTMGAAIAAHVANAGFPVLLLDIVPRELTEAEQKKGLDLDDRRVRDRFAREGLERIAKIEPPSFMSRKAEALVSVGNLEDDLHRLAECDWIVEAVVENLEIKRQLVGRVEEVRKEGALVTTNTSGLPIHQIASGRSEEFRRHFFGTHFFNPPRYMKLLEVIRGEEADPLAVSALADFATRHLGKGVVFCKDTPNFIGNRILSVHGSGVVERGLAMDYLIEEIDALTGPLIGRPKTATFRLQDLVGIDVSWHVAQNLYELIPDDPWREQLRGENGRRVIEGLLERGRKGNKTGAGFYRKTRDDAGRTAFHVLDPETFDYREPQDPSFESVDELRKIGDTGERVAAFFDERWDEDRGARLVRAVIADFIAYAAFVARDVAYDLPSMDRAIRWGFSYELGPFELWDALGVERGLAIIEAQGHEVADWVREMTDKGCPSFYHHDEDGRVDSYYDWQTGEYRPMPFMEGHLVIEDLRRTRPPLETNASASLHALGPLGDGDGAAPGVLLAEFHSKANAIDDGVIEILEAALRRLDEESWQGLVIGNDGANFCVGANLMLFLQAAEAGRPEDVEKGAAQLQGVLAALRRHRKPVVAAVHGMALGGGAEVAMAADRIVAHSESYVGLVEAGVGLLPGGGGLMELVRRVIDPATRAGGDSSQKGDPLPAAQQALETVAMGKVSKSADHAREMGFLRNTDRVVMHRDLLLSEARDEVLRMVAAGYVPEPEAELYAGGAGLAAALQIGVWSMQQSGWASPHDVKVAQRVAHVLAGGDGSAPSHQPESHFLRLEAEGIAALAATEKSQERMKHMLETGKPLRN